MSCSKSPSMAFCSRLLSTTTRSELKQLLEEAPLSVAEKTFILDVHDRMSLKALADKYSLSVSGIAKRKQNVFIRLHKFEVSRLKH